MLQRKHVASLLPKMQHFRQQKKQDVYAAAQSLGQGRAGQGRAGLGRAQQVACMQQLVILTQCFVHLGP